MDSRGPSFRNQAAGVHWSDSPGLLASDELPYVVLSPCMGTSLRQNIAAEQESGKGESGLVALPFVFVGIVRENSKA